LRSSPTVVDEIVDGGVGRSDMADFELSSPCADDTTMLESSICQLIGVGMSCAPMDVEDSLLEDVQNLLW
jgi:hypothetical protein